MTTWRRAGVLLAAAVLAAGGEESRAQKGGGGKDPSNLPAVTVTATAGSGKLQTSGTINLGGKTFKRLTVFATNKSGGVVYKGAPITTAPGGGTWPAAGTLDISAGDGDYNVWAVLEVVEENTLYGSPLSSGKVGAGGQGAGSYIFWSGQHPKADQGTVVGEGTYTVPNKMFVSDLQMMVVDSAGGPFQVLTATKNPTADPKTWTAKSNAVASDRTYNTFAILTLEPEKDATELAPAQYSAPVVPVPVPKQ